MKPSSTMEEQGPLETLAIFTCEGKGRRQKAREYLDLSTGEILEASIAKTMGVTVIRPDTASRRLRKLRTLRKEPRDFARFLLRFRDRQCKFLVSMETLVSWYAHITGRAAKNIRRYFEALIRGGILEEDLMLQEDFMVKHPRAGKESTKGDTFRAHTILSLLRLKQRAFSVSEQNAHFC